MKKTKGGAAYKKYRDDQLAWASAEDLLLILANELVRTKEKKGMNLFWDTSEEEFMRDYLETAEMLVQS